MRCVKAWVALIATVYLVGALVFLAGVAGFTQRYGWLVVMLALVIVMSWLGIQAVVHLNDHHTKGQHKGWR